MSQLLTIFSGESNKQWNYTVQPVAMESGQAWDRGTPTYMCSGSLLMSRLCFFPLHFLLHAHNYTIHIKGHSWMCCLPYFHPFSVCSRTEYILVWDMRKAQIYHICPRRIASLLQAGCLASHEGDGTALKLLCVLVLYDLASAALCSAHSCCWLHCLLPGGHKLIIHTLSHQCGHTYCNPDIPAPSPCRVNSC